MSYILDALKKAERKRRQDAFPNLLSVNEQTGLKAGKPARWPYILISILLVSIGAVLPKLYEKYSGPHNRERSSVMAAVHNDRPTSAIHDAIQRTTPANKPAARQARKTSERESVNAAPAERKADTAPVKVPASASVTSLPEMGPPAKRITLKENDLPPAIQQELPKVQISALIYDSNPSSRIISIHGSAFHEGDNLAVGLRLESIIPEGIILSYKGFRFYRPIF